MRRMYSENQLLSAVEEKADEKGISIFENIVDKDGHKRFIEGEVLFKEITGLTGVYGKWSLSGSHLLIVVAGEIVAGTYSGELARVNTLPSWILDKIVPVSLNYISIAPQSFYTGYTPTATTLYFLKQTGYLELGLASSNTFTSDKTFRIQFDLLIDNE